MEGFSSIHMGKKPNNSEAIQRQEEITKLIAPAFKGAGEQNLQYLAVFADMGKDALVALDGSHSFDDLASLLIALLKALSVGLKARNARFESDLLIGIAAMVGSIARIEVRGLDDVHGFNLEGDFKKMEDQIRKRLGLEDDKAKANLIDRMLKDLLNNPKDGNDEEPKTQG